LTSLRYVRFYIVHAFAYEVGLRECFEEDEADRIPIFTLSSPRDKAEMG